MNDYTENNGWWPSVCPRCETGDESDPTLFWNAVRAVPGLHSIKGASNVVADRRLPAWLRWGAHAAESREGEGRTSGSYL